MNRFKIVLGDEGGDGHGISKTIIIDCNYTHLEIKTAFRKAERNTGIKFSDIASDYEDNTIPKKVEKQLLIHGINVWEGFDLTRFNLDEDVVYIDGSEHYIELLMKFIKIELPYLTYSLVKDEIPELDMNLGYGLYSM